MVEGRGFEDALINGKCDMIDVMLANGYVPSRGEIYIPCRNGDVNVLLRLLPYDQDVNNGLIIAVSYGHRHLLNYLVSAGADVNYANRYGVTPLHTVKDEKICKWLIDRGGQQLVANSGETPLSVACKNNRLGIAELLLIHGANQRPDNPLFQACESGKIEIVKLLLRYGGKQMPNRHWCTPLSIACMNGHEEIVELLLENSITTGKESEWQTEYGDTPLHKACSHGRTEIVKLLLKHGGRQLPDKRKNTPLHRACRGGHTKVVKILLKHGGRQLPNKRKNTPLHLACREGHTKVVKVLLNHGAQQIPNKYGVTPIEATSHPRIAALLRAHE